MSDPEPFIATIRAAPEDDAPRLIYADWLDDQGDAARAEFIRVQCELARRESADLRAHETALLAAHHDAFAGRLARPGVRYRFHRGFIVGFGHTGVFMCDQPDELEDLLQFLFRKDGRWTTRRFRNGRTFVDMIRLRHELLTSRERAVRLRSVR